MAEVEATKVLVHWNSREPITAKFCTKCGGRLLEGGMRFITGLFYYCCENINWGANDDSYLIHDSFSATYAYEAPKLYDDKTGERLT